MRKFKIKPALKYILPLIPPTVFTLLFFIIKGSGILNGYLNSVARPLRMVLGKISSIFPFSLMELLCTAYVVWLLYYIIKTVYLLVKKDHSAKLLGKRLFVVFLTVFYIASSFSLLFGLDYYGETFAEKSGLDSVVINSDDLTAVTKYFAQKASELSYLVPRDADGSVSYDINELFDFSQNSYNGVYSEFPFLKGQIYTPKKMLFSVIMSYIGFTGIYFPFTGESNVNVHFPDAGIPSTITHEIAHQKGFTSEAECNFIGILAAVTSDSRAYQYSGYLSGLTHLMNTLAYTDAESWNEIYASLSPYILKDWKDSSEYWDKMEISLTSVTENIYDGYLKTYGQDLGMSSYGACVDLLVKYFSKYTVS